MPRFYDECKGDFSGLAEIGTPMEDRGDNWIKLVTPRWKAEIKMFSVGSMFGINNGRVSKLMINTNVDSPWWGFEECICNYDRGWDIMPTSQLGMKAVNSILRALGDEPLSGDYEWYELDCEEPFGPMENLEEVKEEAAYFDSWRIFKCKLNGERELIEAHNVD